MTTKKVERGDYPKPTLRFVRGKWVVEVNIPSKIRHLFGAGTTRTRRKSTLTTDKALAQAKLYDLTTVIYNEFDDKQQEHDDRDNLETEKFAVSVINNIAKEFNYNRGVVPTLDPNTDYQALLSMKGTFDGYVKLLQDELHSLSLEKSASELMPTPEELQLIREALTTGEVTAKVVEISANLKSKIKDNHSFTPSKIALLQRYNSTVVQNFFQDLLTEAAQQQGKIAPIFEALEYPMKIETINSINLPKGAVKGAKPLERSRKTVAKGTLKVSDLTEIYFKIVDRDYDKADTQRKLKRGVNKFKLLMGDPPIQDVKITTAYEFIEKQLELTPNISNRLIKDTNWTMSKFFNFLIKKGYVTLNPFLNMDLKNYGSSTESYLPYTTEELFTIFNYDWKPQERLLLSIMITTGMRLDEAGMLTWERFNDTEYQGMRYFSLLDTEDEIVAVKNDGSKRLVPLHSDLMLPAKGTGRIFSYHINEGKCSTSAGRAINPILHKLVPHKKKSAHSFRGTLKVLLRDADVSKEVNDYYTGHAQGDAAGKSYGGIGIVKRYEEISKARHPWLKK